HGEAAGEGGSGPGQVRQEVGAVAARLFQRIGKDSKAILGKRPGREDKVIVGGKSEGQNGRCSPSGLQNNRTEGVAKDLTQQRTLRDEFGHPGVLPDLPVSRVLWHRLASN